MNIDHDRGDAPRRLAIRHDRGGMLHSFGLFAATLCFATPSMSASAEEDDAPPSSKGPPSSKPAPGHEPDGKCAACGMQNEDDAKFCDQCGKSMAARSLEDEDDEDEDEDDEDDDKAEESAKPAAHPPPPERMSAPAKMSSEATLASILNASGESPLALKTAAIKLRQVRDTAAGVTGKTDAAEIVGGLLAVPSKLERGKRAQDKLAATQAKSDAAERLDLVHRLNKTGTVKRSKILADVVSASGERTGTRIRSKYARMDLGVLRGLVTDLEGDAPKQRRNPFEPSEDLSRETSKTGQHGNAEQRITRAKAHPDVVRMFNRPGNTISIESLAKSFVAKDYDLNPKGAA